MRSSSSISQTRESVWGTASLVGPFISFTSQLYGVSHPSFYFPRHRPPHSLPQLNSKPEIASSRPAARPTQTFDLSPFRCVFQSLLPGSWEFEEGPQGVATWPALYLRPCQWHSPINPALHPRHLPPPRSAARLCRAGISQLLFTQIHSRSRGSTHLFPPVPRTGLCLKYLACAMPHQINTIAEAIIIQGSQYLLGNVSCSKLSVSPYPLGPRRTGWRLTASSYL